MIVPVSYTHLDVYKRQGQARRRPFRHVHLENVGHALLIVKRPSQGRVDVGQVCFGKMIRCRRGFVLALGGEIGLEERRRVRRRMRGVDDIGLKRFGAKLRRS